MRIEVTIAKTTVLPAGALDALAGELSRRINNTFPDNAGAVCGEVIVSAWWLCGGRKALRP